MEVQMDHSTNQQNLGNWKLKVLDPCSMFLIWNGDEITDREINIFLNHERLKKKPTKIILQNQN